MIYRGRVKRYYPKEATQGAEARPNHTQNTDGTRGATAAPRIVVSAPAAPARDFFFPEDFRQSHYLVW